MNTFDVNLLQIKLNLLPDKFLWFNLKHVFFYLIT